MKKITKSQALRLGKKFDINFDIVPFDEFLIGLNIEQEHKNITKNKLETTALIAIAHLEEDPRYYHYLEMLEDKRKKYWKKHVKPSIYN